MVIISKQCFVFAFYFLIQSIWGKLHAVVHHCQPRFQGLFLPVPLCRSPGGGDPGNEAVSLHVEVEFWFSFHC